MECQLSMVHGPWTMDHIPLIENPRPSVESGF